MTRTRTPVRHGVTLFELLVVMTVMSFLLATILSIFGAVTRNWGSQISRGKAIQTANLALAQITKELRAAISFQATDGTKTNTFTLPANTDSSGTFIPRWNRTYLAYAPGYRVHYYLSDLTGLAASGSILWREVNPASTGSIGWAPDATFSLAPGSLSGTLLTASAAGKVDHISSLVFTTTGMPSNTVQATVTVSYKENGTTSVYSLSRCLYLGNHN